MSRGVGPLQLKLLSALRRHGREARLDVLAALAAGLIEDLEARVPYGRAPSRNQYTATARAITTLRRRGLVDVETVGSTRGRMEFLRSEGGGVRLQWRFKNPTKYVLVQLSVDSSGAGKAGTPPLVRENGEK